MPNVIKMQDMSKDQLIEALSQCQRHMMNDQDTMQSQAATIHSLEWQVIALQEFALDILTANNRLSNDNSPQV